MLWKNNNFGRKNLIIVKFFEVCYSILMKGLLMKRKGAKKVEYAMLRLLAEKYKDDIFRFCVRLTGSKQYAEDLFQDTFMQALQVLYKLEVVSEDSIKVHKSRDTKKYDTVDKSKGAEQDEDMQSVKVTDADSDEILIREVERKNRNFLMGIAANIWKNRYRKYKLREQIAPLVSYDQNVIELKSEFDIEKELVQREFCENLHKHIDHLPKKLKIVICMYYVADMKIEEIAETLHIPNGTVNSRLFLAKKKLKSCLEADGYEV